MNNLLVVDDDLTFCQVLSSSLSKRGFNVKFAHNVEQGSELAEKFIPDLAILDLQMPGKTGLELIPTLNHINDNMKILVLTGYASITTAVEAIKLGAIHYLAKPTTTDEIISAFNKHAGDPKAPVSDKPMTIGDISRSHILSMLKLHNNNISLTARKLGIHRRTLQRKLDKIL